MNRIDSVAAALSLALIAALAGCAGAKEETKKTADAAASDGDKTGAAGKDADAAGKSAGDSARDAVRSAKDAAGKAADATKDAAGKAVQQGRDAAAGAALKGKEAAGAAADKVKAAVQPEPPPMPDAEYRQAKPAPLAVQPRFIAPVPVLRRLKNGARVLITENPTLPLVAVDVLFLHGSDADPIEKAGLAEFTADMVDEGTKSRPAAKLAEEIEDLAAQINAGAGRETSSAHLNCLTETLPKALELLADVVQNPAFRTEDVERVRGLKLTQLQAKKANPGALANDEASRILFGAKHPWGQPSGGTPESVGAITPDDLAKFHDTWWVPGNAVISVAGDVKATAILKLLEERFGKWKGKSTPAIKLPALPELKQRSIVALDKPGTTQSQVWVVGRMFPARDPDSVTMRLANNVLGGLFTSRLNMNLREKHGYSYGVGSGLGLMRDTGTFRAAGGIVAKNTVEAVTEYENELKTFSSGEVTDDELAKSKEAFIRSLPSALETNDAVASALAGLVSLGLPLDYYKTLPARVDKVHRKDIARAVTKWMHPDRWPLIIVGPVAQSEDALKKLDLGPVEVKAIAAGSPMRAH